MKILKKLQKKASFVLLALMMTFSSVPVMAAETNTAIAKEEVRLQDDFYQAVNKDWIASAQIEPGYRSISVMQQLHVQSLKELQAIFDELLKNESKYAENSTEKKMINLYHNYLDMEARNKAGITPIKDYLQQINKVSTIEDVNKLMSDYTIQERTGLLYFSIFTDFKDSTKKCLYVSSTSLLLGNSDYYTEPNEIAKATRTATTTYLYKIVALSGNSEAEAKKKVDNAFKFEEKLAPYIMGGKEENAETNIFAKIYNVSSLKQLDEMAPNIKPSEMMAKLGYDKASRIILEQPKWLKALNDLYTQENLELIKDYIEVKFISSSAGVLSEDFEKATKELQATLYGVQGETDKEEEALSVVSALFSDEIGRLYVEKTFSKQEKADVEAMVKRIIEEYKLKIQDLEWMSEATKKNAIKKLDAMVIKIGYPDEWTDYSALKVKSAKEGGSLAENLMSISEWSYKKSLETMNDPVNRKEFIISPQTVNACYNPTANDITFPAAILEAPFYDINQSEEANLGGIGMVIAHEISHSFDVNGALFDEKGNTADWWTKEDYAHFENKAKAFREFYSKIELYPGYHVDGDLTVSENIADITAISCMLDILRDMENSDYKAFFEAYARLWRSKSYKEFELQKLQLDSHSPDKVRVNAVVQQFEEFYKTYGVKEGDGMYVAPEDRISVY